MLTSGMSKSATAGTRHAQPQQQSPQQPRPRPPSRRWRDPRLEGEETTGMGSEGGGGRGRAGGPEFAETAAAAARLPSAERGVGDGWPRPTHVDTHESASESGSARSHSRSHSHQRSHSRSHSSHGERSLRFGACDNGDLDDDLPPRTFAEGFHVFSTITKTPIPTGFVQRARTASARGNRSDGTDTERPAGSDGSSRARRKHFFPLVKASSPLVLLQSMPPALPHDPHALEPFTPQRVLARQQAARERAAALERASSLANQPRHELDAAQLYELDRQQAMQAHALAIDEAPARRAGSAGNAIPSPPPSHPSSDSMPSGQGQGHDRGRSVSMDKYEPTPLPAPVLVVVRSSHSDADELLSRKFRVSSPRKKQLQVQQQQQQQQAKDARTGNNQDPASSAGSAALPVHDSSPDANAAAAAATAAPAHPPPNQRAFARQAQERLWEAERRAMIASRAAAAVDSAWVPPAAACPSPSPSPSPAPSQSLSPSPHRRSHSRSPSPSAASSRPPPSASLDAHRRHLSVLPEEMPSFATISAADAEESPRGSESGLVSDPHDEAEGASPGQSRDGSATERAQTAAPRATTSDPSSARRHRGAGSITLARARLLLSDPDMRLVRTQGAVRPRKTGAPPRLVARAHDADDPCVMLSPLTDALAPTPRVALIAAVGAHAQELSQRLQAKEAERRGAPQTRPTAMILLGPAALQLTQQQHLRPAAGEEEKQQQDGVPTVADDASAPSSGVGGGGVSTALVDSALAANVPRLDIAASIPAESLSPRKAAPAAGREASQHGGAHAPALSAAAAVAPSPPSLAEGSDAHATISLSGTEAASAGRLASSMAPLSAALNATGMGDVLTGLTTLSQLLPPAPSARKMSELYAHYQRHLARTGEYFAAERARGRQARERLLQERDASARAQALWHGGGHAAPPVEPPPSTLSVLHRVDSQGFILGPDRSTPSLAPGSVAFVAVPVPVPAAPAAAGPASSAGPGPDAGAGEGEGEGASGAVSSRVVPASVVHLSSFSKLSSAGGLRRRGGGNLGMLEGESGAELAESLAVLADMVARSDASDNEQALRVLCAFDRNRALRLPPLLLRRAQDLHDLLDRRAEEAAKAETDALLAAAAAKAAPASSSSSAGAADHSSSESEGEQGAAADQFFALRAVSRRKAKAKFRLASQMRLFGNSSSSDIGGKGGAPSKSGLSPHPPSRSRSQLLGAGAVAGGALADTTTQRRMLDTETARRIIGAITAAAAAAEAEQQQQQQQQRAQVSTPATARSSCNNSRSSTSRGGGGPGRGPALSQDPASRIVGAALPPTFMSLYESFGVAPSTDGSGLAARPAAAPTAVSSQSGNAGQTLLDVVRARANLERKLRQDAFVARLGGGSEADEEDPARLRRMEELHGLQLEEAKEKEQAEAILSRRSTGGSSARGSVASPTPVSRSSIASHSNRGSNNGPLIPAPQTGCGSPIGVSSPSAASPSAASRFWARSGVANSRDRSSQSSDSGDHGSLAPAPDCGSPVAATAATAVAADPATRLSATAAVRSSAHFPLPTSALRTALMDSDSDSDSDLDVADSLRRMAHQRAASQQQPPPPVSN